MIWYKAYPFIYQQSNENCCIFSKNIYNVLHKVCKLIKLSCNSLFCVYLRGQYQSCTTFRKSSASTISWYLKGDNFFIISDLSMVIRSYTPKLSPMQLSEHKLKKEKSSSPANVDGESPRGRIPEGRNTGS